MTRKISSRVAIGTAIFLVVVAAVIAFAMFYKALMFSILDIDDLIYYAEFTDVQTVTTYVSDAMRYWWVLVLFLILGLLPLVNWWGDHSYQTVIRGLRNSRMVNFQPGRLVRRFRLPYAATLVFALVLGLVIQWGALAHVVPFYGDRDFLKKHYVDPKTQVIDFGSKKRNLVWLVLESVEMTMLSKAAGGVNETTQMPELDAISRDPANLTVRGVTTFRAKQMPGTSFSVGGIAAQTGGVPVMSRFGFKGNDYGALAKFLPGAYTMGDLLQAQGYRQAAMMGAKASFGGMDKFFSQHGNMKVLDRTAAARDGIISPDLENMAAWAGFDDKTLYRWAKSQITEMSASSQPFFFIMETADTHPPGFDEQSQCPRPHQDPMLNVLECASKQAADFIDWIKRQPFYENTTIVVTGDHLLMQEDVIRKHYGNNGYNRSIYNTIINPAVTVPRERLNNRIFSSLDFYPTVVAALGANNPPNQLGWGVNLFSAEPTLVERYGQELVFERMHRASDFYDVNILGLNP